MVNRQIELKFVCLAKWVKCRKKSLFSLKDFNLKIENSLPFLWCSHKICNETFMPSVLSGPAKRAYIWNWKIHIIREEGSVYHCILSAFADTGRDPFAVIETLEGCSYIMKVIGCILSIKVCPVDFRRFQTLVWRWLCKITMFNKNIVRIEHSWDLISVCRTHCIVSCISFSNYYSCTVTIHMTYKNSLGESSLWKVLVVNRLFEQTKIFFSEFRTFQLNYRFDLRYWFKFFLEWLPV